MGESLTAQVKVRFSERDVERLQAWALRERKPLAFVIRRAALDAAAMSEYWERERAKEVAGESA
jgi:hypothetical protein